MTMLLELEVNVEHRVLQQRITELEAQLRDMQTIFGCISDIILVMDANGRYLEIVPTAPDLLYRPPQEVLGKTLDDVMPAEEASTFLALIQETLRSGQTQSLEYTLPVPAGELWFQATCTPRDEQSVVVVIRDITERKRQEQQLLMRQFALDNAGDMVEWLDATGRFVYVNESMCNALGYTHDELTSMTVSDIDPNFPSEDFPGMWEHVKKSGTVTLETLHQRKDGTLFPVEVSTTHLQMEEEEFVMSFVRDISERKRQEDDLLMQQFALDNASDMVKWMDEAGRFVYVNDAVCNTLGYTRDELLGMTLFDVDPNFAPEHWAGMWAHVRQAGTITLETQQRRKDGTFFPVEVSSTLLQMRDREFVMGFVRDISERKRAEAERAALQEQVIDAQRATVRELSTPLIPIADGIVIMPLIGAIDTQRAQQVMESLLEGVATHKASTVILDITGVQVVDTQVADTFIRAAQAVKLLGARVMLTGIQPQIAQTLVQLGVELKGIDTRSTLQAGIAAALPNQQETSRR